MSSIPKKRCPSRIREILQYIEDVWYKYPDLRLGQLILNSVNEIDEALLYFMEDKDLLQKLKNIYGDSDEN